MKAHWDRAVSKQRSAVAEAQTRQAEAIVQVVTQYVGRVQFVREKGDIILKEVPVYVAIQADAACTIRRGFVSFHDAAVAGELAHVTGDPDAPAEGRKLSVIAGTIASNYQSCHENAKQLKALQDWIRQLRWRILVNQFLDRPRLPHLPFPAGG